MNQELYNQFLNAAATLTTREEISNNIEAKKSELEQLKIAIADAEKKPQTARTHYRGMFRWGNILTIIGFVLAGLFFLVTLANISSMETEEAISSDALSILPAAIIFVAIGVVGIILTTGARKKRVVLRNKYIEECEQLKANLFPKMDEIVRSINSISEYLAKYTEDNAHFLSFLPYPYHNLHAVGFMLQALERLRADNLTDVINLYEQELHHLEQMRVLNQNAEMQRIHAENMEYAMQAMQRNQERINANLRGIQTMQIMDMFLD